MNKLTHDILIEKGYKYDGELYSLGGRELYMIGGKVFMDVLCWDKEKDDFVPVTTLEQLDSLPLKTKL